MLALRPGTAAVPEKAQEDPRLHLKQIGHRDKRRLLVDANLVGPDPMLFHKVLGVVLQTTGGWRWQTIFATRCLRSLYLALERCRMAPDVCAVV